jgi:hypothetical protein
MIERRGIHFDMAQRIKTKHTDLLAQVNQAIAGISGVGLGWPVGAPTSASVTAHKTTFDTAITATNTAFNAWKVAIQAENAAALVVTTDMKAIDETTDLLYGPSGAQKNNFGLTPKGAPISPLHKLIKIVVKDGIPAGSILFDWENIEGATYEVQWFSDSAMTQMVGSAVSTSSEFTIAGLTSGTQYWMRVRPQRGGQTAEWSDPATRVAPV